MLYADLKDKKPSDFKRLTGVLPATFADMCDALAQHLPSFGRPPRLGREDRLLLTLMYWREYRTLFHIAAAYGVSEATACRTVRAVEDALTRSGRLALPGRKALTQSQWQVEVVVLDATECPVERPQKGSGGSTAARRSATPKKPRSSRT